MDARNMAGFASLIGEFLATFRNERRSRVDEESLRKLFEQMRRESSTSTQDREIIKNLMQLLETSISKHQAELQSVAQDKEAYKSQVDELTRKMEELMKKDRESSSSKADMSVFAKLELFQLLQNYKQERKKQRYNEASSRAPKENLPWADDVKAPYQTKPQQYSGGAYGKFDRQNRPTYYDHGRRRSDGNDSFERTDRRDFYHDHGRRRTDGNDNFERPDRRDFGPQYQRPHKDDDDFHDFSLPDGRRGGAHFHSTGPQGGFQQTGNRRGRSVGPGNRGRGHQFGDNATAGQAGYGKKHFQQKYNPNKIGSQDQGSGSESQHPCGHFQHRGRGRGQFYGRGNFNNTGPIQQNSGQTPNKEEVKKSEQNVDLSGLSGLSPKELEMLFLQIQQEAQKKGQENQHAPAKQAFKKKKKTRSKKKAEPKMKVDEKESEEVSEESDDSDSEEEEAAASDNKGAKKKTSKNTKVAKESDADAFEMFKASECDLSQITGVDINRKLKGVMMVDVNNGDVIPCVPKTVKDLLDFKEKHPNAKSLIMKKD